MLERGLLDTGREDCWRRRTSQIADLDMSGLKELPAWKSAHQWDPLGAKPAAVIKPLRNDRGKIQ
jgi:hypothetical protein